MDSPLAAPSTGTEVDLLEVFAADLPFAQVLRDGEVIEELTPSAMRKLFTEEAEFAVREKAKDPSSFYGDMAEANAADGLSALRRGDVAYFISYFKMIYGHPPGHGPARYDVRPLFVPVRSSTAPRPLMRIGSSVRRSPRPRERRARRGRGKARSPGGSSSDSDPEHDLTRRPSGIGRGVSAPVSELSERRAS